MNKKKLIPMLALLGAVAALAAALALLNRAPAEDTDEDAGIVLSTMESAAADTLNYTEGEGEAVALTKTDGTWVLDSDPLLTIDQTATDAIVADAAALTAKRALDAAADTAGMGFETPSITFRMGAGAEAFGFTAGAKNSITGDYYVKLDGSDTVYTVAADALDSLCKTVKELYLGQSLSGDIAAEDVAAMTVDTGAERLQFTKDDAGNWALAEDAAYSLDQDAVNLMANTACALQSTWTITAPEADAVYGLDAPDAVVTLRTAEGTEVQLRLGGADPEDDTLCYAAATGHDGLVYEVAATNLNAYAVTKESLFAATPETAATAEAADSAADYPVGDDSAAGAD